MGETNRIIFALKRGLRARGITYAMLAKRINLSEPSVKRILSRGSLSLPRLERICEAAGLSMEELVRPVAAATNAASTAAMPSRMGSRRRTDARETRIVERGTWRSLAALKWVQQPRYDSLESLMTQV